MKKINSERIVGLDLFRILSVFVIFLFHSQMHLMCNYGFLNNFISMGAVFMTAFYMLSGYVLFIKYGEESLIKFKEIVLFYYKRFISIFALYYFVALVYILFQGKENLIQNIILLPIELLGLQSVFSSLFGISHNSGTWFISCLMLCYLIFPYIKIVVEQMSVKEKIRLIFLCIFILVWSPLVVRMFGLGSIYSSPFFRMLEFIIGVALASMKTELRNVKKIAFLFKGGYLC